MTERPDLPQPECESGYPVTQVEAILGDRMTEFNRWMRGQTGAICDGRKYDHNKREYHNTNCGPHGMVVYAWDLRQFLDGGDDLEWSDVSHKGEVLTDDESISYWDYRVLQRVDSCEVIEVYYSADDKPIAWAVATPYGDTEDELAQDLHMMLAALDAETLTESDLPSEKTEGQ
jgi:hypothetical protein